MYNNKKAYKYESESESKSIGYVFFSFIAYLLFSQKELKRLINLGKKIKSLNHLIYIPIIG